MIIVTGGAGFIGSNLVATLKEKGYHNIAVCDRFGDGEKWKNLHKQEIAEIIPPRHLLEYLAATRGKIDAVFHMGAISSTTATDVDEILDNNFTLSLDLWKWCTSHKVPFIYASSAATYGSGENGFVDSEDMDYLLKIRPLNPYGWSKSLFDMRVVRGAMNSQEDLPQWVGLKFFNVYGPNEYHKGEQKSVLCHLFPRAKESLGVRLFKSENPDYEDGEQKRDFVYVKDCCDIMVWFMENPEHSGIFNVGTGNARTFNDLAQALFSGLDASDGKIEYIDMPNEVVNQYQYYTKADLAKLRNIGYDKPMTTLEDGVGEYVAQYLNTEDAYR